MSVSRSPAPSSIDLSGVPARVAEAVAQVVAVCHEQFRSDPCPEAFEEAELRVRETMNALACELLGAVIEKRDDGASRIERDGQSWFRVAATPRTIMTSLGPLTYRRARYRSGASGSSPVPVDESLGLVHETGATLSGECIAVSPSCEVGTAHHCVAVDCDPAREEGYILLTQQRKPPARGRRRVRVEMRGTYPVIG